jgi:hypothetical protein
MVIPSTTVPIDGVLDEATRQSVYHVVCVNDEVAALVANIHGEVASRDVVTCHGGGIFRLAGARDIIDSGDLINF